jgi:hypothetical protein
MRFGSKGTKRIKTNVKHTNGKNEENTNPHNNRN